MSDFTSPKVSLRTDHYVVIDDMIDTLKNHVCSTYSGEGKTGMSDLIVWCSCFTFAATLVAVGLWIERRKRMQFESKWPAISDDEFLAACSPGTSRATALRVRRIVAEQLGVPYERIHPNQHLIDDLDCC